MLILAIIFRCSGTFCERNCFQGVYLFVVLQFGDLFQSGFSVFASFFCNFLVLTLNFGLWYLHKNMHGFLVCGLYFRFWCHAPANTRGIAFFFTLLFFGIYHPDHTKEWNLECKVCNCRLWELLLRNVTCIFYKITTIHQRIHRIPRHMEYLHTHTLMQDQLYGRS